MTVEELIRVARESGTKDVGETAQFCSIVFQLSERFGWTDARLVAEMVMAAGGMATAALDHPAPSLELCEALTDAIIRAVDKTVRDWPNRN